MELAASVELAEAHSHVGLLSEAQTKGTTSPCINHLRVYQGITLATPNQTLGIIDFVCALNIESIPYAM